MRLLIAAATAAVLATPGLAGEWTGAYVGLGVGSTDIDGPGAADGDDVTYGIHAGYDYDFGDWVVGGELEYDRTDINLGNGVAVADNIGRLKFKAGYDFGDILGYAVVGAARAQTSIGDDTGAVYGLGLAYAVNERFTISGELLRHDFNNFNGLGSDLTANSVNIRASYRF